MHIIDLKMRKPRQKFQYQKLQIMNFSQLSWQSILPGKTLKWNGDGDGDGDGHGDAEEGSVGVLRALIRSSSRRSVASTNLSQLS